MGRRRVFVIGNGMTKFEKPGRRENFDYPQMGLEAGTKALQDAGIRYDQVEQACCGYVYGDSCCGQRVVYQLGITGIPVYNVNNNCATGSTALFMAKSLIEGGLANCVLAIGFEKMQRGSLKSNWHDRTNPTDIHNKVVTKKWAHVPKVPGAPQMFGNSGREHMEKYGTKPEHFAKVAYKNHKHSVNNPYSQFQDEYSLEEIMKSPMIYFPLTKLQCCPTSDGSAAVVVASEDFVRQNGLEAQAVEILALEMSSDFPTVFSDGSAMQVVGYDMAKNTAKRAFKNAGLTPNDVQVVELHDCFSANELVTYEALGLCGEGEAGAFIDRGDNTYGGKYVVNPSGGLISKGHPLGATGLAQCSELCWQLKGQADKRQVPGAKVALQHNLGLGGAVVIGLYALGFPEAVKKRQLSAQATSSASPASFVDLTSLKTSQVFAQIEKKLAEDGANIVKEINGVFCFKVRGKNGKLATWIVDAKHGKGAVKYNVTDKADATITVSEDVLYDLFQGKLGLQNAFVNNKLQISGNIEVALRLPKLQFKTQANL